MPLLEAHHVARRHPDGRRWLLESVSLRIDAGQRLSIAGPSGSGKTLLLRALALLDPLDAGEVQWNGETVRRDTVPDFRRSVIYLHQRAALIDDSVEAALRRPFSLAVHRRRRFDRQRIVALLGELGRSESFLGHRAGDLSGGEIQIVALLRALQLDPTVLLLDEPTAALDPQTTAAVERLLTHWHADARDARAMIWVTHDAEQGQRVAGTTLYMNEGRLEKSLQFTVHSLQFPAAGDGETKP